MENNVSLQDRFYPIRTSLPSCILFPESNGNHFELKPQFINTLPRFHGLESEDAYLFIREFEEVCQMMRISQLTEDAVRLRFIPFALKDLAKKWLYNLPISSISSWDDFVKVFLKKFYPIHKTALMRKNIMQFKQEPNEPFWKYLERFKDLLALCPHHGIEKWRLCQIIYDGLDYQTKTLLESMCQGEFLKKDENQGWDLFEALAEKTIQWESCPDKPTSTTSRTGMHSIESSIAAEAKITQLMKRIELLESREPTTVNQVNPPPAVNPGCTYCHDLTHLFEECPVYQSQMY